MLGAQWHHRLSFDIDITVDERTPLGLLDKRLDATTGQGIEIIEHAAELATGGLSTQKAVGGQPFGKALACSLST